MIRITVGLGSCGIASSADLVYDSFIDKLGSNSNFTVEKVGCIGVCRYEPLVEVFDGDKRYTYINVHEGDVEKIISATLNSEVYEEKIIKNELNNIEGDSFFSKQTRIVLSNCGIINPEKIDEYLLKDGYLALKKVLSLSKKDVIDIVKTSKLRGRGGAGFPTGNKWEFASKVESDIKYVCCNADEGDPGAFMDRAVLEGDPHAVIEAMTIAAYSISANHGFIYVRAEYPLAVKRLEIAISQAYERGLLGENILGTDFSFDLKIRLGAGAFVCGEETALIKSIEGKRGEPSIRPPFPTTSGLYNSPTLINNVETYANIPRIILKGTDWFLNYGTEKSGGTKVFALGGDLLNTGLLEVPIGITLRDIVFDIGGGIANSKEFKAAQTGGPSGGCIPSSLIDTKMDYDDLLALGSMMGSGGLIVMNNDNCMVDVAKFFLDFTVDESCGKCTPCRLGTKKLHNILEKITSGNGEMSDLDELKKLSSHIKATSFCGLGSSAPNPVLSTIRYFEDEYINHIQNKKCSAKRCKSLIEYNITDMCTGCSLCSRKCPVNAISGELKGKYTIDKEKCIKCGLCYEVCKFKSIEII